MCVHNCKYEVFYRLIFNRVVFYVHFLLMLTQYLHITTDARSLTRCKQFYFRNLGNKLFRMARCFMILLHTYPLMLLGSNDSRLLHTQLIKKIIIAFDVFGGTNTVCGHNLRDYFAFEVLGSRAAR